MNNLSVKSKLLFFIKIKYHYIILLLLTVLSLVVIINQRDLTSNLINEYNSISKMYLNKEKLKKELSKDIKYTVEENELISNNNSIRDITTRLESSIAAVEVQNTLNHSLSSIAFIIIPIIIASIIIVRFNMDYVYKVEKLFLNIKNIKKNIFSDIVTIIVISCISIGLYIIIYLLINYLYGIISPLNIEKDIILSNSLIDNKNTKLSNNGFIQYTIITSLTIIISIIGYSLTKIFKSGIIGNVTILVYMMILPNLGAYDLKNIYMGLLTKNFNTNASTFMINQYTQYNNILGLLSVSVYLFIFIVGLNIVLRKRSKYH